MLLFKVALTLLPALALAETSDAGATAHGTTSCTTTLTSTATLTKTITLSRVTVTSTWGTNSTSYMPTGATTSFIPTSATPTVVPATTSGLLNAAGALDATRVAFAGVAGMLVVALM
jgi:hypothetical protein